MSSGQQQGPDLPQQDLNWYDSKAIDYRQETIEILRSAEGKHMLEGTGMLHLHISLLLQASVLSHHVAMSLFYICSTTFSRTVILSS